MFVGIKHGIRYSGMGAWNGMMSDEEIWKVATFLEHIGSLPPEVQANSSATQYGLLTRRPNETEIPGGV